MVEVVSYSAMMPAWTLGTARLVLRLTKHGHNEQDARVFERLSPA
jgi:hypothetical protein